MGTPYASQQAFHVTGGDNVCVELRAPQRGIIRAIKIKQLIGDAADATAVIYSKYQACPPGNQSSSLSASPCSPCDPKAPEDLGDPDLYRVTPDIAVSAGAYLGFEKNYMYCNRDGNSTNRLSRLYLSFSPDGSGAQEWGITMEIEDAANM